ncbi:macro domain-containing protein [Halobacillus litoralis]|uniref:macro domain-containing protein n=1 Tax=Halobacillus litoralis TaxID=45668 RepID=UPI001CD6C412|nr:macro domain-containing protein [Halobacillus litoralis]MCA1021550.1 macro domain-containing protein [Halobacillus litoralis]
MMLVEYKRNLFTAPEDWYFAHCISRDAAMGAGIAKEFVKQFPELKQLRKGHQYNEHVGGCMLIDRVFNLITKERYFDKPTYASLEQSLCSLKLLMQSNNVKRLAIPKIGCGLDRLEWNKVKAIIEEVFKDLDVKIVVCYL